jgi:hypothetical protein
MVLPDATYTSGVIKAIERLEAAKFKVTVFKNSWYKNKDNLRYRGINVTLEDEATHQVFEFQLHTESSLAAKEAEHGWYDWRRLPDVPQIELDYAQAQSNAIFGTVSFPDRAIDIAFENGKVVLRQNGA